jgi:uncharacterized protein YbjT (DUF2867 family)
MLRPDITWREADLSRLTTPEAWTPLLVGVEIVVNAAGALQQGLRDNVAAVQLHAMTALYVAARSAGVRRIVQVSAAGAASGSPLEFYSTKGRADEALQASGLDHVILRPGLVISPAAYGGTALLRALAAFPAMTPLVLSGSPIQTVWIGDLADVVAAAVSGRIPSGSKLDLVERPQRSLAETVGLVRGWLGLPPAPVVRLPNAFATMVAAVADVLGWLGWRSPLRSTAMAVMRIGVLGNAEQGPFPLGDLKTLSHTLRLMPAGPQEVWFARLWLLKPLILGGLAAFWAVSGAIGLARLPAAVDVLTARGITVDLAQAVVLAGGIVDIGLGLAILVRPLCAPALRGTVLVGLAYLAGAAVLAPDLWLDPLGPMVKVFPAILLSLVGLAVLEER